MASDRLCSVAAVFSVTPVAVYSPLKQLTLTPTSPSIRPYFLLLRIFLHTSHEIYLNSKVLIMTNQRAVLQLYPKAPLIRTFSSDSPRCNSALFSNSLADLDGAHDSGLVVVVM